MGTETRLSKHFTLEELTYSKTTKTYGIKNIPNEAGIALATRLCEEILEPIRERWGRVRVNSGYRSPELNSHPSINGSATSDHVWDEYGCAVDCQFPDASSIEDVFNWIRLESNLPFDQVILERGKVKESEDDDCIHIGFRPNARRQAKMGATNNKTGYENVEVA